MTHRTGNARKWLTAALLLNLIAWFIPDLFFPDSHFQSSTWPLHARLHTGAAAFVNGCATFYGLYLAWFTTAHLRAKMRWTAALLAAWNVLIVAFFMLTLPFIMEPGDHYISWTTDPRGAGNDVGTGIEGAVYLMAGLPTLLFLVVLRKLKNA